MITIFNEDSSGSQCKLDSTVQGTDGGAEKRRRKTSRSRRSRRMGGRKNIKQEKDERSREVFNTVEGIYSRRRHLGEERKLKKCRRVD